MIRTNLFNKFILIMDVGDVYNEIAGSGVIGVQDAVWRV